MRYHALAFALVLAACGTTPTASDLPTRPQVRQEFLTCYKVGSHIRRLPEECTGPKEPPTVKEH